MLKVFNVRNGTRIGVKKLFGNLPGEYDDVKREQHWLAKECFLLGSNVDVDDWQ